jgi:CheY-like chemotaxis protein
MIFSRLKAVNSSIQPRLPGDRLTILVVDDDDLVQSSMREMLRVLGHTARIVGSGEEALTELSGGFLPDLVILDLAMPGLGGEKTLPLLRTLCPDMPVVITTGRADRAVWNLVAAHPYVILLPKPFTLEELRQLLDA